LSGSKAISEISKNAEQLAKMDKLSGVLLVAKGDKILLHQSYGLMSRTTGKPNKKITLFPTASMSKMFTATAIAQLIERGKLSLEDTLEQVLPSYPDKAAAKKIKIRHLLSHQSGLGNFFNDEYRRDPKRYIRPADYFPLFANKPLFFEPGTKFSYSNAGMVVLGAVVEQISKQRFEDYLHENIFMPAGMKNTFYNPLEALKNRIASLHSRFGSNDPFEIEPRKENSAHRIASPAGDSFTTAEDMLLFIRALQKGRTVKQETLTQFTTLNALSSPGENYAFGFDSKLYNGKRGYGHSGGAPGVNTNTITFGDGDYTVVILTNYDPGFAQVFARNIAVLLANVPTNLTRIASY
jgi:CubicO group peptidase (beta-lactamase class C family)